MTPLKISVSSVKDAGYKLIIIFRFDEAEKLQQYQEWKEKQSFR